MTEVLVRYWAAAREAAGVESETVRASSLAELLRILPQGRDARFARVLAASSLLLDGIAVGHRDPQGVALADGLTVEVLPPFAGG